MNKTKNKLKFCSVPQCKNHENENSTYHYFPKDVTLKKKWLQILKMHIPNSLSSKVCSEHFTPNDYFSSHAYVLKRKLKPLAIPSRNLPVTSILQRKKNMKLVQQRFERVKKREEKKIMKVMDSNADTTENLFNEISTDEAVGSSNKDAEIQENLFQQKDVGVQAGSFQQKDFASQVDLSSEQKFSLKKLLKTDAELNSYTSIHSFKLLDAIVQCMIKLKTEQDSKMNNVLSIRESIILTFVRLKLNMSYVCLAVQFGVSVNTCKNTFLQVISNLQTIFQSMIRWPDKDEILKNIPKCFKKFSSTVAVLDCTEIKIENTKCLNCKIATYSHYKGANTVKILLCVTPSGLISYGSPAYGGRASDKQIFLESDILNKTIPNIDSIMVDKGFLIEAECALAGVKLFRPPFLNKNRKLSASDAQKTASIAAARVHVERVIQRIKQFKILQGPIPYYLVKYIDSIIITICGLINLSSPILGEDKYLN